MLEALSSSMVLIRVLTCCWKFFWEARFSSWWTTSFDPSLDITFELRNTSGKLRAAQKPALWCSWVLSKANDSSLSLLPLHLAAHEPGQLEYLKTSWNNPVVNEILSNWRHVSYMHRNPPCIIIVIKCKKKKIQLFFLVSPPYNEKKISRWALTKIRI